MKKWMNFETMFRTLAEDMSKFLKMENIKYERSGCFGGYHFEIYCDNEEVEKINKWLDENTITEK